MQIRSHIYIYIKLAQEDINLVGVCVHMCSAHMCIESTFSVCNLLTMRYISLIFFLLLRKSRWPLNVYHISLGISCNAV